MTTLPNKTVESEHTSIIRFATSKDLVRYQGMIIRVGAVGIWHVMRGVIAFRRRDVIAHNGGGEETVVISDKIFGDFLNVDDVFDFENAI